MKVFIKQISAWRTDSRDTDLFAVPGVQRRGSRRCCLYYLLAIMQTDFQGLITNSQETLKVLTH